MKITAVHIQNVQRIKDVRITPDADRSFILLGGKNAQGKTSILRALEAAVGGKRALSADPVRHGAEEGRIFVELDGGELTIERVIQPDGDSTLEVRDRLGGVKAPQDLLNKMLGSRLLDPLGFLQLAAKDQRAQLMKMIEGADRIVDLDQRKERAFSKRTEVGRDLKSAEGELARLGPAVEVGKPIDVAAIAAEKSKFAEQQRAGDGAGNVKALASKERATWQQRVEKTKATIADLERQLAAEREGLEADVRELAARAKAEEVATEKLAAAAAEWGSTAARRAEIDADLAKADSHNRTVIEAEQRQKRRSETAANVASLTEEVAKITKVLETIEVRKAEILGAAKLPVEGLSVDDQGVTLNGVPFAQASGAERHRVAIGLAIHGASGLDDVFVRDGALLDEESLQLVVDQAEQAGKRVWIERVSDRDPGVIVIHDGQVLGQKP